MAKINWKVRLKNKAFWLAFVPALALLIQAIANIFGITIDLNDVSGKVIAAIDALFMVLVIIGVVTDPTTEGVSDGKNGYSYEKPAPNVKEL